MAAKRKNHTQKPDVFIQIPISEIVVLVSPMMEKNNNWMYTHIAIFIHL